MALKRNPSSGRYRPIQPKPSPLPYGPQGTCPPVSPFSDHPSYHHHCMPQGVTAVGGPDAGDPRLGSTSSQSLEEAPGHSDDVHQSYSGPDLSLVAIDSREQANTRPINSTFAAKYNTSTMTRWYFTPRGPEAWKTFTTFRPMYDGLVSHPDYGGSPASFYDWIRKEVEPQFVHEDMDIGF